MGLRHDELESLLFDWEDGRLDDAGVERLRELLRGDASARALYVEQQTLTAALRLEGSAGLGTPPLEATAPTRISTPVERRRIPHLTTALGAAAVLVILGLAGRLVQLELGASDGERVGAGETVARSADEATARGVALVTRLVDIDWTESQAPLEIGDALSPGALSMRAGFAQIEFFCGATVILEGPASLELVSPTLARVRHGRLRVQVPPAARGFSLEAGDMRVVDLGTEFGLSVSEQGAGVQVFDGEVELHRPDRKKRLLTAGRAVLRGASGDLEEAAVTPERFLDISTLESHARGQRQARHERWRSWSEQLRRDPRLIAYYAFDQEGCWKRKLPSSVEPVNSELDGAIVGARRVRGRWDDKGGLEFKKPGDRVRVQIPGEYSSLTLACWVKIDSLDRWYNSLFLTDNYNQGEPHWQILDTGQLFFSVRSRPDDFEPQPGPDKPPHRKVLSPPFWKPAMSGRWLHIATTYDVDARRTTHYLNGELLHSEEIPESQLVSTTRIGSASIGNWSLPTRPDAAFAIRNLNGSIDEFAILAAPLSAAEIKEMYEAGKP